MENTRLFRKVYGCLLGGAIGDALGGPVEHWTPEEIRALYGNLDHFVPYDRPPSHHGQFGLGDRIGGYTDDTRLKHLFCKAIFKAEGKPRAGDLAHVMAEAYHHASDAMVEGFVKELIQPFQKRDDSASWLKTLPQENNHEHYPNQYNRNTI